MLKPPTRLCLVEQLNRYLNLGIETFFFSTPKLKKRAGFAKMDLNSYPRFSMGLSGVRDRHTTAWDVWTTSSSAGLMGPPKIEANFFNMPSFWTIYVPKKSRYFFCVEPFLHHWCCQFMSIPHYVFQQKRDSAVSCKAWKVHDRGCQEWILRSSQIRMSRDVQRGDFTRITWPRYLDSELVMSHALSSVSKFLYHHMRALSLPKLSDIGCCTHIPATHLKCACHTCAIHLPCFCHTSSATHHLPQIICHTSSATHHLPHIICHTSSATRHLPHIICHTSSATHHLPHIICHTSSATHHLPHIICHTSFATHHLPHIICHTSSATHHLPHIICHTSGTHLPPTCFTPAHTACIVYTLLFVYMCTHAYITGVHVCVSKS